MKNRHLLGTDRVPSTMFIALRVTWSQLTPDNPADDETEAQRSKAQVQARSLTRAHATQEGTGLSFWRPGSAATAAAI